MSRFPILLFCQFFLLNCSICISFIHGFQLAIQSLPLPGYGFSEGASMPGLNVGEMSLIFLKLMKRLGHEKFYVQGGSLIASNMATLYPEK